MAYYPAARGLTSRAGSYVLAQKWGALLLMKDLSLNVRWQAGNTYYYRLEVGGDFYVVAQRITWRLAEVSAAEALPKLRQRRLQPAFDLDKIWGNWPWLKPRDGGQALTPKEAASGQRYRDGRASSASMSVRRGLGSV